MFELRYEEDYYHEHKTHLVGTVLNVMKSMGLSVFDKGNGVSVYGLSLTQVEQLFEDMGLAHVVCFMDYQAEYGYDEYQDPITDNKDCVEVTFDSDVFLYDIEDN